MAPAPLAEEPAVRVARAVRASALLLESAGPFRKDSGVSAVVAVAAEPGLAERQYEQKGVQRRKGWGRAGSEACETSLRRVAFPSARAFRQTGRFPERFHLRPECRLYRTLYFS